MSSCVINSQEAYLCPNVFAAKLLMEYFGSALTAIHKILLNPERQRRKRKKEQIESQLLDLEAFDRSASTRVEE